MYLGRKKENPDFDFCLKRGSISFGKKLATHLKSGFVLLDKEHGACRVVKKAKDKIYTLDFTDFRGADLQEDVLHRDFTINTLALSLEDIFSGKPLDDCMVDHYSARKDIKTGRIKIVNKDSFSEDPLRILRAFSFSCMLGFKIEEQTLRSAKRQKNKLKDVSSERIRDELFKIFDTKQAFNCLSLLDELGLLKIIVPEIEKCRGLNQGPYHHLDIWKHSLETLRQFEMLLEELKGNKDVREYVFECLSSGRKRSSLLKLASLLHDIGKPGALRREDGKIKFHGHEAIGARICQVICQRLKLSNDETEALKKVTFLHLRPGYLADSEQPSARAVFRFFRDADKETVSVLLVSLADQRSTRGPLTTRQSRQQHERVVSRLIKECFKRAKETKAPRLINGDDLIKEFKLKPSPLIGKILLEVEELQAIGKVKNKEEALKSAARIIKKNQGTLR